MAEDEGAEVSDNYARDYAKVVRYSEANHSDLPAMLAAIHPKSWQGRPTAEHTPRLVAADFMQELGRHEEAEKLRDTTKHAFIDYNDGKIHTADEVAKDIKENGTHGWVGPGERQYMETALWSSLDHSEDEDHPRPMDDNFTVDDIHPDTMGKMIADWSHFRHHVASRHLIGDDPNNFAPHHFWLTRNGHGTGFRDHDDYYEGNSHHLEDAADQFGEFHLDVGDDGHIHGYHG